MGVVSGGSCAKLSSSCDHVAKMIPPLEHWGRRFIVPDLHDTSGYRVSPFDGVGGGRGEGGVREGREGGREKGGGLGWVGGDLVHWGMLLSSLF